MTFPFTSQYYRTQIQPVGFLTSYLFVSFARELAETFFSRKFLSFVGKKKIYTLILYCKNKKHLAIAVTYIEDGENS